MYDYIVVHYDEIGIKGNNRNFFERKLVENITSKISKYTQKIFRRYGKIICFLKKELNVKEDKESITKLLELTPGISSFSFATTAELDIEKIKEKTFNLMKNKNYSSFKVQAKRSFKKFPLTSPEINKIIGEKIYTDLNISVNLKNPEVILNIEIGEKEAYIFDNKIDGIGGLAIGSSGKVICSLSGGIDSPVASYMMMKRGCEVIFVHIQNNNLANKELQLKIEDLCKKLSLVQNKCKLYIIPFSEIQKQLIMYVPADYRMIIYRRFMTKIINEISISENSKAIITGDSIGQVASQTLDNIICIYEVAKYPVLSPLVGLNKQEIIKIAKKIDTFETSIRPYPDCCSFMIAKHPKTNAKLIDIKNIEENIPDKEKLVLEAITKKQIINFENK